jgi:hypothetical protein
MGTNEEIWKDIEGYEGLYQISNLGRVKSLPRIVSNHLGSHTSKERILKLQYRKDKYINVHLLKDRIEKIYFVHRLVAKAFIPNPDCLPDINHKDENPSNNRVENLEWCTEEYNMNYGNCIEKRKATFARNESFLKANVTKVRNKSRGAETPICGTSKDGNIILSYRSITEASHKTGISKGHLGECVKGIRKSAGSYYWNYKTN